MQVPIVNQWPKFVLLILLETIYDKHRHRHIQHILYNHKQQGPLYLNSKSSYNLLKTYKKGVLTSTGGGTEKDS